MMTDKDQTKIFKANKLLQAKVGTGILDQMTLEKCEQIMKANKVDFVPMAQNILKDLENAIQKIKTEKKSEDETKQTFITPVMQLKANAGIFGYELISELAGIVLNLLENIDTIDKEALKILTAHQKTLNLILSQKIKGNGGLHGKHLIEELTQACNRYFIAQQTHLKN